MAKTNVANTTNSGSTYKTLITGSTGLVGGGLEKKVKGAVPMMGRAECDVTEQESLVKWLSEKGVESPVNLIHCAADPIVSQPSSKFKWQLENNVVGLYNLLELLPLDERSRVVNISSATVYGSNKKIFPDSPMKPESYYAVTKLASELLGIAFREMHGTKTVSVRPVAVVGERATHGMLPDICRKIMKAYEENTNELILMSNSVKPFVHVDDLQDALAALIRMPDECWVECPVGINVGPEDNVSVEDVVKAAWDYLCSLEGQKPLPKLLWEGSWKGDAKEIKYGSNVQARTFLGWKPKYKTSLDAAMAVAKNLLTGYGTN